MALGPGREFDLLRRFLGRAETPLHEGVRVGPGDDAAVLAGGWVVSTDLSIEHVHFRTEWLSHREAGYRATAAALSDLAAMAAEPVGVLVSLAVPDAPEREDLAVELYGGVAEAAGASGAAVLGGDLTRSPGPWIVDVTVVGRADPPVLRSGAAAGDEIWVTGVLGAPAAAVRIWREGGVPSEALRAAFRRPVPRIPEARWLCERAGVRALVDLSDGLAGDAGHLAAASAVGVVLDLEAVPVAGAAAEALGAGAALDAALHGGEDYELLVAARPGALDEVRGAFFDTFGLRVAKVGRVVEGAGVWAEDSVSGERRALDARGFDHFRPRAP